VVAARKRHDEVAWMLHRSADAHSCSTPSAVA
jgi:hypothetical protein